MGIWDEALLSRRRSERKLKTKEYITSSKNKKRQWNFDVKQRRRGEEGRAGGGVVEGVWIGFFCFWLVS